MKRFLFAILALCLVAIGFASMAEKVDNLIAKDDHIIAPPSPTGNMVGV